MSLIKLAFSAHEVNDKHINRVSQSIRNHVYPNKSSKPFEYENPSHNNMLKRNHIVASFNKKEENSKVVEKVINNEFKPVVERYNKHKRYVITKNVIDKIKKIGLPIAAGAGALFAVKTLLNKNKDKI
jgi:GH35 family endo-1,4-beta-xylanase